MTQMIAQLMDDLKPDAWRVGNPFSPELLATMDRTLNSKSDDEWNLLSTVGSDRTSLVFLDASRQNDQRLHIA